MFCNCMFVYLAITYGGHGPSYSGRTIGDGKLCVNPKDAKCSKAVTISSGSLHVSVVIFRLCDSLLMSNEIILWSRVTKLHAQISVK